MGLDIQFYRVDDYETMIQYYEEQDEKGIIFPPESEVAHITDPMERLNLILPPYPNQYRLKIDHSEYPDHIFKIGYARSSYNSRGINLILSNAGCGDLYSVFDKPTDVCRFQPSWPDCLIRAQETLRKWKAVLLEDAFLIERFITHENLDPPTSVREAIDIFSAQHNMADVKRFPSFSSRDGHFFFNGMTIYGLMPGQTNDGSPCIYVVLKLGSNERDFYTQALEILIDSIMYVMDDKSNSYYVLWSA